MTSILSLRGGGGGGLCISISRAAASILSFFHSDSHESILCLRPPFIIRLETTPVSPPLALRFTRRHHPRRAHDIRHKVLHHSRNARVVQGSSRVLHHRRVPQVKHRGIKRNLLGIAPLQDSGLRCERFPDVCPEPVWVKMIIVVIPNNKS